MPNNTINTNANTAELADQLLNRDNAQTDYKKTGSSLYANKPMSITEAVTEFGNKNRKYPEGYRGLLSDNINLSRYLTANASGFGINSADKVFDIEKTVNITVKYGPEYNNIVEVYTIYKGTKMYDLRIPYQLNGMRIENFYVEGTNDIWRFGTKNEESITVTAKWIEDKSVKVNATDLYEDATSTGADLNPKPDSVNRLDPEDPEDKEVIDQIAELKFYTQNVDNIVQIANNRDGTRIFDKLTRISNERRVQPLDKGQGPVWQHRSFYNTYCLEIGDAMFMVPPEFIMVTSESTTLPIVTLRQENTQKERYGHSRRTILVDLVFNSLEQINGFQVPGPDKPYYVDGLRPLLAEFKMTPFLPITNDLINGTYGIYTVVLQNITISTVEGFPDLMKAQLTLQEVSMFPYIELPDICFSNMIDWDLFRYYYQSRLTETHEYKKLQSLPERNERFFKMSILDQACFIDSKVSEYNVMDIITEKTILDESKGTNYKTWLDSREQGIHITSFQCGYSNLLTTSIMAEVRGPVVQFLGGMDTIYNITFETRDSSVIRSIESCHVENDSLLRNNPDIRSSVGFVKLESELTAFTGSLFVMIDSVTTNTVPGFPGLYSVQMNCVSYDITQSDREELHGFRPFSDTKGLGSDINVIDKTEVYDDQVLTQSSTGIKRKAKQDNYAETKLAQLEVYPDLHLPTYKEVEDQINKISAFRSQNGLTPLPYESYPARPANMLQGHYMSTDIPYELDEHYVVQQNSIKMIEYKKYVDPDFYVFYPTSYESYIDKDSETYDKYYVPPKMSGYSKQIRDYGSDPGSFLSENDYGEVTVSSDKIAKMIDVAKSKLGCTYKYGASTSDASNNIFDCSSFVWYCMYRAGLYGVNSRFDTKSMNSLTVFTTTNTPSAGCILWRPKGFNGNKDGHTGIMISDTQYIHAANTREGVKISKYVPSEWKKIFRINGSGDSLIQSSDDDEGIITEEKSAPKKNGKNVIDKVASAISDEKFFNDERDAYVKYAYAYLTSHGFSEYAAAGIIGSWSHESSLYPCATPWSGSFNEWVAKSKKYVEDVDNGKISKSEFIGKGGFGLAQWTSASGIKPIIYKKAKEKNRSVGDLEVQLEAFVESYPSTAKSVINRANSVEAAVDQYLKDYGYNDQNYREKYKSSQETNAIHNKRIKFGKEIMKSFSGKTVEAENPTGGTINSKERRRITEAQINSIKQAVAFKCMGETQNGKKAMAQLIFDRLTALETLFPTVADALTDFGGYAAAKIDDDTSNMVESVFTQNNKAWPAYQAFFFTEAGDKSKDFAYQDTKYERISDVDSHCYWGRKKNSKEVLFSWTDEMMAESIDVVDQRELYDEEYNIDVVELDPDRFGRPILADVKHYSQKSAGREYRDVINKSNNGFYTAFCDMYQYSCRGRLVRAFPAYLFCILDETDQWYEANKLWTNYYMNKSIVDIQTHASNDMPVKSATIVINNYHGNLSRTQSIPYDIYDDPEIFSAPGKLQDLQKWLYKQGLKFGFGPKLTEQMIRMHEVIYNHAKLREGTRVHLRIGYGSDPLSLAPVINGSINDVTLSDQISIVVSSDGQELIADVIGYKENDSNNFMFGVMQGGQEASNIISKLMTERENWVLNTINLRWAEQSKHYIEHYGLYRASEMTSTEATFDTNAKDSFSSIHTQWDILKNIYRGNYAGELGIHYPTLGCFADGEANVIFNKYNLTPWDAMQTCVQTTPEYILKTTEHQFDSSLYFGLPFWMERFRYDRIGDTLLTQMKSAAQVHYIDSADCIIDDQMTVTGKFTHTNIKVSYQSGETQETTQTLHSDTTISNDKQSTKILDSNILQDLPFYEPIWETIGIAGMKNGYKAAKRMGLSNLVYGWNNMYQGSIILNGCPGIKPDDYILINDTYRNIFGICIAREVLHSFSVNTGYTTTIVPGMIAFPIHDDMDTGIVEMIKSFLSVLSSFAAYTQMRKAVQRSYESSMKYWAEISSIVALDRSMAIAGANTLSSAYKTVQSARGAIVLGKLGISTYTAAADCIAVGGVQLLASEILLDLQAVVNSAKALKAMGMAEMFGAAVATGAETLSAGSLTGAIMTASGAAAPETGGLSVLGGIAMCLIINVALDGIIEWISDRNLIRILPLWRDTEPMANRIKDGEHILLCGGSADEDYEDIEGEN